MRPSPSRLLADAAGIAMDLESEVTSELTAVPFTDLAAMAGEVWPQIEPDYLACLLDGRYRPGRSSSCICSDRCQT